MRAGRPRVLLGAARMALWAGALAAARPLAAQAPEERTEVGRHPRIGEVVLRGVRHVPADELREGLATRPSECRSVLALPLCWISDSPRFVRTHHVDPLEVERDALRVRLYYWKRGFRDAHVATRVVPGDDGASVVFAVDEGPSTIATSVSVRQTAPVLSDTAVARALALRAGDPLSLVALDSSVARLRAALWERGYADAVVRLDTAVTANALDVAAVKLLVDPGARSTVAEVRVEGNEQIADGIVRRLVALEPGDLFHRGAVAESQRNLYLSRLFSAVVVTAPPGDSSKVVAVRVEEAPLRHLDLTGGFNTIDFLQVEGEYTRFNFLGGARRLAARATLGNLLAPQLNDVAFFRDVAGRIGDRDDRRYLRPTAQASLDLTQPWVGSSRNQLGLGLFAHRRIVPGVAIDRGYGASAAFTRELAPRAQATAAYRYEATAVAAGDVYFCVTFGFCTPARANAASARHTLSPLSLAATVNRTDDALTPTAGYTARGEAEHASALTASDFRYNRVALGGAAYRPVRRQAVLAARVRAGIVRALRGSAEALRATGAGEIAIVHPRKRFYAGGARSVRGYGENALGPRVLTVAPGVLVDSALPNPCSVAQLADRSCNPNVGQLPSSAFQPQPLGGTTLVEGTVEYRFPIWDRLRGVAFVDAALLRADALGTRAAGARAVTPGFGVHLKTAVGPVRLELGVRPTLVESLPVVTQVTSASGETRLVRLATPRRFDPLDGDGGALGPLLERLTLHLAVGPSF